VIRITAKIQVFVLVTYIAPLQNISPNFVDNCFSYDTNRQTNKGKNITSLPQVMEGWMDIWTDGWMDGWMDELIN